MHLSIMVTIRSTPTFSPFKQFLKKLWCRCDDTWPLLLPLPPNITVIIRHYKDLFKNYFIILFKHSTSISFHKYIRINWLFIDPRKSFVQDSAVGWWMDIEQKAIVVYVQMAQGATYQHKWWSLMKSSALKYLATRNYLANNFWKSRNHLKQRRSDWNSVLQMFPFCPLHTNST